MGSIVHNSHSQTSILHYFCALFGREMRTRLGVVRVRVSRSGICTGFGAFGAGHQRFLSVDLRFPQAKSAICEAGAANANKIQDVVVCC